jgi:transposase
VQRGAGPLICPPSTPIERLIVIAQGRLSGSSLPEMTLALMKTPVTTKPPAGQVVKDIRRAMCQLHSSGEKIGIVLSGRRGEDHVAERCRTDGIAQSLYDSRSEEFLEAGKKRLAGDTARQRDPC